MYICRLNDYFIGQIYQLFGGFDFEVNGICLNVEYMIISVDMNVFLGEFLFGVFVDVFIIGV